MWVPKIPKRADFCGCPPCGLCFVWVDENPEPVVVEQEQEEEQAAPVDPEPLVVDGVLQMARELLGRDPNPAELQIIKEAADRVHQKNLLRKREEQEAELARKQADADQRMAGVLDSIIKDKIKEREAPKLPPKNYVTIDDMDPETVKERCDMTAPIDDELLARERLRSKYDAIKNDPVFVDYIKQR